MSPASSASSRRPFLARTSRVRGKATRRSPIAVSPRIFSMVTLALSLTGCSIRIGGCGGITYPAFLKSGFFGAARVFDGFAFVFALFFALLRAFFFLVAITPSRSPHYLLVQLALQMRA